MVAMNDEELARAADAQVRAMHAAVPGLLRPVPQRAFESYLRDMAAVIGAFFAGELPWPTALTGIESCWAQARACVDDDLAIEALCEASTLVTQAAGRSLDALPTGLGKPEPREPQSASGTEVAGSGPPDPETTSGKADAEAPESAPGAASGTEVAGSGPADPETTPGKPDAARPESESGTGFAISNSNSKTKANPKVQTSYPKPKPYPKPKSEGSTS